MKKFTTYDVYVNGVLKADGFAMPTQLFYSVTIPVTLWFISRNKKQSGKTLFIDARNMGHMVDRKHRDFSEEDINQAIKDAEAHAAEDKKRKEEIEVRNNAESLVYNSQKTLDELGDKVSGEEKAKVEAEVENVRKSLEGTNVDAIKDATEKLTKVFYELSEKLYSAQAAAAQAEGAADESEAKEGTVYDAEYKVEDDDKKDE